MDISVTRFRASCLKLIRRLAFGLFVTIFALVSARGTAAADEVKSTAVQVLFDAIEKALRAADEPAFKAQWHPDGYDKNLVGGSGNTGASMFRQGSRKKWFPKPDLAKATTLASGDAVIVPCEIWSWDRNKAVDAVDALVVKVKGTYVMLGSGEKRAQVDALAERWLKKQPLAPPDAK
jgi:hypothetical protein